MDQPCPRTIQNELQLLAHSQATPPTYLPEIQPCPPSDTFLRDYEAPVKHADGDDHDISSSSIAAVLRFEGAFKNLKAINLTASGLVEIRPGSLPTSLQVLDLSYNKIDRIEGLLQLTRLRVLNLSHNRIRQIGHGLAKCTSLKELFLADNKIRNLGGFYRLRKLAVLDLSYNELSSNMSAWLGQLAANKSSLVSLNVLGNPALHSLEDLQHFKRLVACVLPAVTLLNKQPMHCT